MTKFLVVMGAGVIVALGLAGCQGPHPYRSAPPTTITVPSSGSTSGNG